MPRQKKPEELKKDELIEEAIAGIETGKYSNANEAAQKLGIPSNTLYRRLAGGKSRTEARQEQQHLTAAEEKALVQWLTRLIENGYPARHVFVREMAEEIRNRHVANINDNSIELVSYPSIGSSWVQRFLHRHQHLKTVIGVPIEAARMRDTSQEAIDNWFAAFVETIEEHNIMTENIYNMDETGFSIRTLQSAHVIIDKRMRKSFQAHPGRQEWVTSIECICADGTITSPFIIFKGEHISSAWIPKNAPHDWKFSCNSKGWTSNIHGLEWLRRCFEPATREKANGRTRLLICDGHDSHITGDFILHCIQNNIILLLLPPHSSHILQPLDVGLFGPLKTAMSSQLHRLIRTGVSRLQKVEWLHYYVLPWSIALTQKNIAAGWRGAGLFPFNPEKVQRFIPRPATPSPKAHVVLDSISLPSNPFDNSLITSSPPDATVLHTANIALKELVSHSGAVLHTPARRYVKRLGDTTERLRAENTILRHENQEMKDVLSARKERTTEKRIIIKHKRVVSTLQIYEDVAAAEAQTKAKKKRKGTRKYKQPSPEVDDKDMEESEAEDDDLEVELLDEIVVQRH